MGAFANSLRNVSGNGNGSGSNPNPASAPKANTSSQQPTSTKAANPEEGKKFVKYAYSSQIGDDVYEVFATGKVSSELTNFLVAIMAKAPDLQKEIYSTYSRKYSKKPVKKFIDPTKTPITKIYNNYDDAEKAGVATPLKVWLYAEPENGEYERIVDQKKIDELEGK